MKQYLDIVESVLTNGVVKSSRGHETISAFGEVFRYDMSDGRLPLLTTKRVAVKSMWVELEGFIKGITSKSWYQQKGCKIWNEWSNPTNDDDNDLGPIYGYQWRGFNGECDQLKLIVETLKTNPSDRRMVCSAWNPQQISSMALPPCHVMWNVVVNDNKVNLLWHQRSCDLMLGVPFNIASYGTLLLLLAKEAGLEPGILQGTLADCHIYKNQLNGAKEQLKRQPRELPLVDLGNYVDIFEWDSDGASLEDYNPHPRINFGAVAV